MSKRVRVLAVGWLVFVLGAGACSEGQSTSTDAGVDAGVDGRYPDPAFIWESPAPAQTAVDETFAQERPILYRTSEVLADLDVRALVALPSGVWLGTASGLFRYDSAGDRFVRKELDSGQVSVVALATAELSDGRLAVAMADKVELHDPAGDNHQTIPVPAVVSSLTVDDSMVWVGTDQGLGRIEAGVFSFAAAGQGIAIRSLALDSEGKVWLATASGLLRVAGAESQAFLAADSSLPDDDVRALAALTGGGVLAGCATGAAVVGTDNDRTLLAGLDGLPYDDITSVAVLGDRFAFGHKIGATVAAADLSKIDYYHSLRWIPAQQVNAVALEADRRWIATPGGVTRIELAPTTLAEKAALFETVNEKYWRLDFVCDTAVLDDVWDSTAPLTHTDNDNDGLWTQMNIVAWSYAAAATGDQRYCEKARRAMQAMMNLVDIPAVSFEAAGMKRGFVARSYVRDDEEVLFAQKANEDDSIEDIWHLVEDFDGHDYYWKGTTSSDEFSGHYFGYPVFYDLCAQDEEERQRLADYTSVMMRYVVENGYRLIDIDGLRTQHGHWDPETLAIARNGLADCMENYPIPDCIDSAFGGGWLNAISILGHLLATYHMTGDPYFYEAYEELIDEHGYDQMVDFHEEIWTVTERGTANFSDHELVFLGYHTLIRYEPNEERRQRWIQSMLDMYQWTLKERNPLWSAIVAGAVNDGYYLEEALLTLREWPEDRRHWLVDNAHRKDATLDVNDRSGGAQFVQFFPYDEIGLMKWNGNPYMVLAGWSNGYTRQAPWPWLLPYWMYRYHGIIQ